MFCNLSEQGLADFDALGIQVALPKGAVIFSEDDASTAVSVICSGQVKLSCASREGKTLILRIAMPGDLLGLGAAISGGHCEVTAETLEPVVIKSIRKDDFLEFLQSHGQASMHAARALSDEYKAAFVDARRLALAPTAAGRLAAVLLDWARSASSNLEELKFTMALTHEELANLAGTSRETVTRSLNRFRRDGSIRIKGSSITILSPERLENLC